MTSLSIPACSVAYAAPSAPHSLYSSMQQRPIKGVGKRLGRATPCGPESIQQLLVRSTAVECGTGPQRGEQAREHTPIVSSSSSSMAYERPLISCPSLPQTADATAGLESDPRGVRVAEQRRAYGGGVVAGTGVVGNGHGFFTGPMAGLDPSISSTPYIDVSSRTNELSEATTCGPSSGHLGHASSDQKN